MSEMVKAQMRGIDSEYLAGVLNTAREKSNQNNEAKRCGSISIVFAAQSETLSPLFLATLNGEHLVAHVHNKNNAPHKSEAG